MTHQLKQHRQTAVRLPTTVPQSRQQELNIPLNTLQYLIPPNTLQNSDRACTPPPASLKTTQRYGKPLRCQRPAEAPKALSAAIRLQVERRLAYSLRLLVGGPIGIRYITTLVTAPHRRICLFLPENRGHPTPRRRKFTRVGIGGVVLKCFLAALLGCISLRPRNLTRSRRAGAGDGAGFGAGGADAGGVGGGRRVRGRAGGDRGGALVQRPRPTVPGAVEFQRRPGQI